MLTPEDKKFIEDLFVGHSKIILDAVSEKFAKQDAIIARKFMDLSYDLRGEFVTQKMFEAHVAEGRA